MTTPAFDAGSSSPFTGTACSYSHTVGAIQNPITFIAVQERNANVQSWTFDGSGFTTISGSPWGWNGWNLNIGYLLGHATNTTVTIAAYLDTPGAGAPANCAVVTYANAQQASPFVSTMGTASTQTGASLGVGFTGEVGGMNIAFCGGSDRFNSDTFVAWGGQTDRH